MRSWITKRRGQVLVAVAVATTAGGVIISSGGGGGGGGSTLANVYINPGTAGASPSRCSTACAYDSTHAYGTYAAAEAAASVGDRINIRSGTLTTISVGKAVEIHPDAGASVTVSGGIVMGLASGGAAIDGGDTLGTAETDRITASASAGNSGIEYLGSAPTASGDPTSDRIAEDIKVATDHNIGIAGNHVVLRYSEVGPIDVCNAGIDDMIFAGRPGTSGGPAIITNAQIIGNYLHGHRKNTDCAEPLPHSDMFDIQFGNSTIAYNRMVMCSEQCIWNASDSPTQAAAMTNLDIIGNYFEDGSTSTPIVQCDGECQVDYNTWGADNGGGAAYRCGPFEVSTCTFTGDVFTTAADPVSCSNVNTGGSTVTFSYTVFPTSFGTTCGTGSTAANVTIAAGAFHIPGGSESLVATKGNPGSCPALDIDLAVRPSPAATTCDAGSDEVG